MWRGSACGLVLFWPCAGYNWTGRNGHFANVGADCEEDDGGGDVDGINSDPSPLGNCT